VQPPSFSGVLEAAYANHAIDCADDQVEPHIYRTNSLGFRGPEVEIQKEAGVFRIVFVGASVLDAEHLPEEQIFAFIVQRRLNELLEGRLRTEVVVSAGAGHSSHYSLSKVANRLLSLDPDLIIELSAADMFSSLLPHYEPTMYWSSRPVRPFKIGKWIRERSGLGRVVGKLRTLLRGCETKMAKAQRRHLESPVKDPPDELLFRNAERPFLKIHRSALLAKDADVPYAIATQAWIYKSEQPEAENQKIWMTLRHGWHLSTATARRAVDRYNDGIRDLARRDGLLLIDLDEAIPRDLDHILDDVHLTTKGHEVAAAAIVDALMQSDVLAQRLATQSNL